MKRMDLSGQYTAVIDKNEYSVILPGTLDENGVGTMEESAEAWHPDAATSSSEEQNITTRFTRKYAYDGVCEFVKRFSYDVNQNKRVFIKAERTRQLKLCINGCEVSEYTKGTLSTPYVFEITDHIKNENEIRFRVSNVYDGLPKEAIRFSSAATNETQTNWLGILGEIAVFEENMNFIKSVRVYPGENSINIKLEIDAKNECDTVVRIKCEAVEETSEKLHLVSGINNLEICDVKTKDNALFWDEYEGNLYTMIVEGDNLLTKSVRFGIRVFAEDGCGHLALNGHRIFLRCETNCCVFADTGHMPLCKEDWKKKLLLYKEYGINTVRFHSHCPPEAAFYAADELGMIIQPELSNWDPRCAFESDESFAYYKEELMAILKEYANHPSFCMLTFGNELQCNQTGLDRLHNLTEEAREEDSTRMYAIASNEFYGARGADEYSDFYTSSNYYDDMLRGTNAGMHGHINTCYPSTKANYDNALAKLRKTYKKPVFSFEVGQYEVLPDFSEIEKFDGFLVPNNFNSVKKSVEEKGFLPKWEKWVEATGELSRIAYREEIEACMRTAEMSGISLLGLQDFPGQGTALVGMINSHFEPKPYNFAKPEKFKAFFKAALPLVKMEKYTYTINENLNFEIDFANYSKHDVEGCLIYSLEGVGEFKKDNVVCKKSKITVMGKFSIPLLDITVSGKYMLNVSVAGIQNEYPIWVYTDEEYEPDNVKVCQSVCEAERHLAEGKTVLLCPVSDKEHFPKSIKTHFTTDFWSVGTFSFQDGYMGLYADPSHYVFNSFPTDFHSDWQWWALTDSRAMILPDDITPVFDVLDSYARRRKLGFLFEAKAGNGKLMVCSMGLMEKKQYPEARAMLKSICRYMESDGFNPSETITMEKLKTLVL